MVRWSRWMMAGWMVKWMTVCMARWMDVGCLAECLIAWLVGFVGGSCRRLVYLDCNDG